MISIKLRQRGFDDSTVKSLLADTGDGADNTEQESVAALRYLKRRRLGPFAIIAPNDRQATLKNRQKSWASLARQGYDPDLIEQVLKQKI